MLFLSPVGYAVRAVKAMNIEPEKPRVIAFEVTRRCRFNCLHCRAEAQRDATAGEMTTEQCKRILACVADFCKCTVILTGGEPMERSDIYNLIRYGGGLGLKMVLATCGYTINDDSIAKLKQAGISALSISIDGASARTHDAFRQTEGAFDSAVKAARAARRAGIRFQINTTITRSNLAEIPAIATLAEELGAYCFNPFILVPTGRGRQIPAEILNPAEYEKLLNNLLKMKRTLPIEVRVTCGPQFARLHRQAEQTSPQAIINNQLSIINPSGCLAARGFAFISYRGDVQTCGFLDVSAGNLIENGFDFAKIWLESEFLNKIRNVENYKGKCQACEYVGICGGCRARAFAMTGDYLAADPVCDYDVTGHKA